jgi:hypothetical protein
MGLFGISGELPLRAFIARIGSLTIAALGIHFF